MSYVLLCVCLSKTALYSPCSLEGVMWSFPSFLMPLNQGSVGLLSLLADRRLPALSHAELSRQYRNWPLQVLLHLRPITTWVRNIQKSWKFRLYVPLHVSFTSLFISCQKLFYGTQVWRSTLCFISELF